jgi:hypothetical protein
MTCSGGGAVLRGIGAPADASVPLHLRLPARVLRGQLRGGWRPGVPHPGGSGCRRLQGSSQDPHPGVITLNPLFILIDSPAFSYFSKSLGIWISYRLQQIFLSLSKSKCGQVMDLKGSILTCGWKRA